jgi:molybdate-binding protein
MKRGFDSPEILIPVSQRVINRQREAALRALMREVLKKAEAEKTKLNGGEYEPLTEQEVRELSEKTRAHLESIGWFRRGSGIR